jgi:hypothetical protein
VKDKEREGAKGAKNKRESKKRLSKTAGGRKSGHNEKLICKF